MELLVSFTLLVAVGAWLAAAYARLHHLHSRVQSAWAQWSRATCRKNECLGDFLSVFAGYLPQGDMLPRQMRRWTEDSQRALLAAPTAPPPGGLASLEKAERSLRRMLGDSVQTLENSAPMREDEHLLQLCSAISVSLFQQEEIARHYNRHAADYNHALSAPTGRLVGGLFGFNPATELPPSAKEAAAMEPPGVPRP